MLLLLQLVQYAIDIYAGSTNQGFSCIAIGNNTGSVSQGDASIAIGVSAGTTGQGTSSVAIGDSAGYYQVQLQLVIMLVIQVKI